MAPRQQGTSPVCWGWKSPCFRVAKATIVGNLPQAGMSSREDDGHSSPYSNLGKVFGTRAVFLCRIQLQDTIPGY